MSEGCLATIHTHLESQQHVTGHVKKLYLPRDPTEPRKKNLTTFHYTGWLIRILIMVYYNPYIIG